MRAKRASLYGTEEWEEGMMLIMVLKENDDRLQHVDGIYGMSASHDRKTALATNISS